MRINLDRTMLEIASSLAKRGTCARRQVGCVLVNKHGHIIGSGYNGVASGLDHCSDHPCPGAKYSSGSGTSLYLCEAIHAEQNALLQCRNVQEIETCYVTISPCVQCVRMLMQTRCIEVVFLGPSSHHNEAQALWNKGRASRIKLFRSSLGPSHTIDMYTRHSWRMLDE